MEDEQTEELPVLNQEELEAIKDPNIITSQIALLEAQCNEMKPNLGAIAEFNKKVRSYIQIGSNVGFKLTPLLVL